MRLGEVCHFTTAARQSAFDSPMLLVGALVVGNVRIGDLATIHGRREDFGGESGTSGNFSCTVG